MIKIKNNIFNENKIIQMSINEENNLVIEICNDFPRVIKDANFSDIEWNYGGTFKILSEEEQMKQNATQFDETLLQDLDNFIQCYQFVDNEKIYTNGSELIQVSRIKQWFDYNNKHIKELEEENEELRKLCDTRYKYGSDMEGKYVVEHEKIRQAIEYINNYMPNYDFDHYNLEKLLKILKGEENEN